MGRVSTVAVVIAMGCLSLAGCTSSSLSVGLPCRTSQLSITISGPGAAAGHEGALIHFRNISKAECSMVGYPFVEQVNGLQALDTPQGYMGGLKNPDTLPLVDLAPNQTATSVLEAINGLGYSRPCPSVTGQMGTSIEPPGQEKAVTLALTLADSVCSQLQVHPVVAGKTGDS